MGIPISVLLLEDNVADAELAIRELRRAGFDPQWQRVETEADFVVALAVHPEVVLADYTLPQFDGLRALALVRERAPDTPFILISGSLGEEAAVAAIKQGATDFLLKDRMARLGTAVARALDEQRQRTAHKEHERKIARLMRIRAVIGGISSAMLRLRDRQKLLAEACRVAVIEGVFPVAWAIDLTDDSEALNVIAAHSADEQAGPRITQLMLGLPRSQRPSHRVVTERRPFVVNDLSVEPISGSLIAEIRSCGYRAFAALPLFVEGRVVAILKLMAGEQNFFDAEEIQLLEWMCADLSFALEAIEKAARLEHLAYFDSLTGLCNARLFQDRLNQFVQSARHDHGQVCVVVVDLKGFTLINEKWGRSLADEVLRQAGARFGQFVTEPFALGRIGADTFAAARPSDGEQVAMELRDEMFAALKHPFIINGQVVGISAQMGVALFPTDGSDGNAVFNNAEAALNLAKTSGESFAYFSAEMTERIALRRTLVEELSAALEHQQFLLHYQPRIDMVSGELIGAEALIRWQHPQRGLTPPLDFIRATEDSGLIVPLGAWVLEAVCAQQAAWRASHVPIVPVAVNISALQLENGKLLKTLRDALTTYALEARYLDLELTESAVVNNPIAATETLEALRKMGAGLALDDFGTGYSSLAHLRTFPFDSVKIDRSFVTDITINTGDAAIASAIIAMAHSLGLKVVAEGVETEGQFKYLRARDCDEMQGHYFSPAVDASAFEMLLRSGTRMPLPAPTPAGQQTLLIVDDEHGIRAALTRLLRPDGYRILCAASGDEGLELLALNDVQVIISDQRMPGMTGTAFLNTVRQLYPDALRIIFSGFTDVALLTEAVNRGAVYKLVVKPWNDELLREHIRDAFRTYRTARSAKIQ